MTKNNIIKRVNKSIKRKANNATKQCAYQVMWGEKPTRGHRKAKVW